METHSVEPCDICGNIGYDELIVTCYKCRKACEHVYCMQNFSIKIPEEWTCEACTSGKRIASPRHGGKKAFKNSSDMLNCDILKGSSKACNNLTKLDLLKMQKTSKVKFLDAEEVIKLASGAPKKGSPSKVSFSYRSGFSSVSVKFHSLERGSPSKVNVSSRAGFPSVNPKFPSSMSKPNPRIVPVDLTNPFRGRKTQPKMQLTLVADQQASQTTKEKEALVNPVKDSSYKALQRASLNSDDKGGKTATTNIPTVDVAICNANERKATTGTSCTSLAVVRGLPTTVALVDSSENHCCQELDVLSSKQAGTGIEKTIDKASRTPPPSRLYSPSCLVSGSNSCTVAEQKILDAEKGDRLHVLPKLKLYQPYLPAVHATWRGGFKFSGDATPGQFYGGFQAQPASRVHRKAYEFSQKMPIILEVQLLPQWALAYLFHNDYPEIDDIALYFFPSSNIARSKENIRNLFQLLEMKNSVIRSCIAGVELLIFSSRQLHKNSQDFLSRSCTRSFLWGVFHNAKNNKFCKTRPECSSTVSPTQCQHFEDSNMDCRGSIDMEIDMVGGKACGRIDVAVSKASSRRSPK